MKNNPQTKSELAFEVDEEYELMLDDDSRSVTVLIKHDYYSSDSDHGRSLMKTMLEGLEGNACISGILIVDSGVKILSGDNDCFSYVKDLADQLELTPLVCSESLEVYGIAAPEYVKAVTTAEFMSEVIGADHLIVIE
ncbi:MAG: hypothetical protein IKE53_09080 [Clostridiales bacterium]|nr:hypothetical protein [Clostridiales bacterium]